MLSLFENAVMDILKKKYGYILLILFAICVTGCKKKVFSPLVFSGKVINGYTSGPAQNCTVVLYKNKNTLMSSAGIGKNPKEIGRGITNSDGEFSMKLKWLDKRDTYYVEILYNNVSMGVPSRNDHFASYKALETFTEFKVYF